MVLRSLKQFGLRFWFLRARWNIWDTGPFGCIGIKKVRSHNRARGKRFWKCLWACANMIDRAHNANEFATRSRARWTCGNMDGAIASFDKFREVGPHFTSWYKNFLFPSLYLRLVSFRGLYSLWHESYQTRLRQGKKACRCSWPKKVWNWTKLRLQKNVSTLPRGINRARLLNELFGTSGITETIYSLMKS